MRILTLIVGIIILSITCSANLKTSQRIKSIIDSWFNSGYDKNIRPNYGEEPVNVTVDIKINDLSGVDEAQMEYSIDLVLRQRWKDDRLVFNATGLKKEMLVLGSEFVKQLWIPDTSITNEVKSKMHFSANTNNNALIRIGPDGTIFYSTRMSTTAWCFMDLKYFPMDSQTCQLVFESYGYTTDDVVYQWDIVKVSDKIKDINLPNFDIADSRLVTQTKVSTTGNYSLIVFEVLLTRTLSFYMNQVYIPVILIVVISWIPFWLDREDTHARVGLGVTTVLTITTLVSETNDDMPRISYLKAMDIYLQFCFWMVFLSLIQYAIVCYFTFTARERSESEDKNKMDKFGRLVKLQRNPSKIDWHCRWIFPGLTILFNLFYWTSYLSLSKPNFNAIYHNEV